VLGRFSDPSSYVSSLAVWTTRYTRQLRAWKRLFIVRGGFSLPTRPSSRSPKDFHPHPPPHRVTAAGILISCSLLVSFREGHPSSRITPPSPPFSALLISPRLHSGGQMVLPPPTIHDKVPSVSDFLLSVRFDRRLFSRLSDPSFRIRPGPPT